MSQRLRRVEELLKREIGEIIRREIPMEEGGMITVNGVTVSSDLHQATVYVSSVGSDEQKINGLVLLKKHRKRFQSLIAESVVLKYTPKLRFIADDSIERGNRVLEILEELESQSPNE